MGGEDKLGANAAALEQVRKNTGAEIRICQIKYLNNFVGQDRRTVNRLIRPMLGFKSFRSARATLQGIELMHMIKKGTMKTYPRAELSTVERFYALAPIRPLIGPLRLAKKNTSQSI